MFWKTVFIYPLANALVFFVGILGGNIGAGIIALTIVVKLVLLPLSYKATVFQMKQQKLQPLIKEIQEKYKDKKEQSEKIMELYKEHDTSPLGCLVLFLQLPIIFALYRVIISGIPSYSEHLYSFVSMPSITSNIFLGINLAEVSIVLAIISGIVQFIQIYYSPASQATKKTAVTSSTSGAPSKPDIATSMQTSMKYTIPVAMVVIGITLPAALTLYIIVTNLFTIVQDSVIKRVVLAKQKKAAA